MLNRLIRFLADVKEGRAGVEQLPPAFWDSELYESLVYFDWRALQFVPDEAKTPDLVEIGLQQSGLALQWVPRPLKSTSLCDQAVRADPDAIDFVPRELATEAMYVRWIKHLGQTGFNDPDCLEAVPIHLRTPTVCALALDLNPSNIWAVPPHAHTPDVVAAFMESEIGEIYLEDLPVGLRTLPLSIAMLERGLGTPEDIPEGIRRQLPEDGLSRDDQGPLTQAEFIGDQREADMADDQGVEIVEAGREAPEAQ